MDKTYIQAVFTIDAEDKSRHFLELAMGYTSKKSRADNNYTRTT
jgi:hypothetical protein